MRHFAEELKDQGYKVRYVKLDDADNQGDLIKELLRAIEEIKPTAVNLTAPGEWRVLRMFDNLKNQLQIPLTIYEDNRFLCSGSEFEDWAKDKKHLRMEFFIG